MVNDNKEKIDVDQQNSMKDEQSDDAKIDVNNNQMVDFNEGKVDFGQRISMVAAQLELDDAKLESNINQTTDLTEEETDRAIEAHIQLRKSLRRYGNRKHIVRAPTLSTLDEESDEDEGPFARLKEQIREAWARRANYLLKAANEKYRNRARIIRASLLMTLNEESEPEEEMETPSEHDPHSATMEKKEPQDLDHDPLNEDFEKMKH